MKQDSRGIFLNLVSFSLPLVLSGVLQQLYQWADAFIVGNVEGELALAAVGSTTSITNLAVTVITGFCLGLSILLAQRFGEGRRDEMRRILSSFSFLLALVFIIAAALGTLFTRQILTLMNTTADTIDLAEDYLSIVFSGVPFLAVYNVFSAVLRSCGNSRAPFYAVLVSSAVNVILDVVFIAVLGWSVSGAAAATVISQAAMTVYLVIYTVVRYPWLRFRPGRRMLDAGCAAQGLSIGLPPMLQSSVTSIGSLILQNFMNGFGTATVAAITSAYRIDTIVMLPIVNLSSGISTLVAQSRGALRRDECSRIFSCGLVLMTAVSLLLTVIVIPTGGWLIALFGAGEEACAIGSAFFLRLASFYIVFGLANAIRGYIEGMGDVRFSSLAGIISLLVRIAGSYAMRPLFGNMVIAWAEALAWCLLLAMYIVRIPHAGRLLRGAT